MMGQDDLPNGNQVVALQEFDPTDYSWSSDFSLPWSVPSQTVIRPAPQPMTGWSMGPYEHVDEEDNARRSGCVVTYAGGLVDVRAVRVQIRRAGEDDPFFDAEYPYDKLIPAPANYILDPLLPDQDYEGRGKYLPRGGRRTLWSNQDEDGTEDDWFSFHTPDIRLGYADLAADIAEHLEVMEDWIDDGGTTIPAVVTNALAIAQEEVDRLAADAAEAVARANADAAEATARAAAIVAASNVLAATIAAEAAARNAALDAERSARIVDLTSVSGDARNLLETVRGAVARFQEFSTIEFRDRQRIETSLRSRVAGAEASFVEQITAATGPSSALVQRDTALEAMVVAASASLSASITAVETAYADADSAVAGTVTTLATQLRGSYGGNDAALLSEGLISQVRESMLSADEALSVSIGLVSAGVGILFDWAEFWAFNAGVEGWTGNGTPTQTGGFLIAADHASDTHVISPDSLGIDVAEYGQVKLRVEKVGAPVWEGYLWWQGPADSTWDAGRRVSFAEPSYDGGRAVITIDPAWTGTVDQMRIDLSTAQDGSNRFKIDWVAVGRPSPGASQAQVSSVQTALASQVLAEATSRETLTAALIGPADPETAELGDLTEGLLFAEGTARADADSANASAVAVVAARMDDAEADIAAQAIVQSTQTTAIEALEDGAALLASDITDLELELDGKVSSAITDALASDIAALGGGQSVIATNEALRNLKTEINLLAAAQGEIGVLQQRGRIAVAGAVVEASNRLNTRVDATDSSLTIVAQEVTTLGARMTGAEGGIVAQASLISAAQTTLTSHGTTLSSHGSTLTDIQTDLDLAEAGIATKASADALNTLSGTVEAQGDDIEAIATDVTELQTDLTAAEGAIATKASTTALNTLSSTVTSLSGTVTSQGSAITTLQSDLDVAEAAILTKASASALTALTTTVTGQGGTLSTHGSAITALENSVNHASTGLATKASSSALGTLSSTVTGQGTTITSQGSAITSLQNAVNHATTGLATRASSSALTALTSTVTGQGTTISSQGSAITALQGALNGAVADFTAFLTWEFATTVEGWSASGATLSVVADCLRSTNSSANNFVTAPNALAIDGRVYDKVRARIRRVSGSGAWQGECYYSTGGHGRDAGFVKIVTAPAVPNEWSILEWDMWNLGATGGSDWRTNSNIGTIWLDLWGNDDVVDIDWVSVGKHGTGASVSAIQGLSTQLTNHDGTITSQGSAITALENSVNHATTGLATKASSSALATLSSTVTGQGTTITSQGSAITSLQNAVNHGTTGLATRASSSALTALTSTVTSQGSTISSQGAAIAALEGYVAGPAAPFSALESWQFLASVEGWTGTSTALTIVNGALRQTNSGANNFISKAGLSFAGREFDKVRVRFRRISGTGTWQGECFYTTSGHGISSSFTKSIAAPGVANAVWAIVEFDMAALTAGGNDWVNNTITDIRLDLWGDGDVVDIDWIAIGTRGVGASVTALETLTSSITSVADDLDDAEATLTAQATAITSLTAAANDSTASLNVKYDVLTGPTGYARYGIVGRTGGAGVYRDASAFLDVPTNPALPTRWTFVADQFIISDGSDDMPPFLIDDGAIHLTGDVIVNGERIEDLSIGTGKVENNAISMRGIAATAASINVPGPNIETEIQTVTIDDLAGTESVLLDCDVYIWGVSDTVNELRLYRNGDLMRSQQSNWIFAGGVNKRFYSRIFYVDNDPDVGDNEYTFALWNPNTAICFATYRNLGWEVLWK
ncbi:MAG TPA: hypothetical protein VD863_06885 [Bradyrhizobium sp.]|nr:hypothetical protein [Bradyrhizobium sp.]